MTCGRSRSQVSARSKRMSSSRSWLARRRASCCASRLQASSCATGATVRAACLCCFGLCLLAALFLFAKLRARGLLPCALDRRELHALLFLRDALRLGRNAMRLFLLTLQRGFALGLFFRGGGSGDLCALLFLLLALQGGFALGLFFRGGGSGDLCALLFLLLAFQGGFALGLFLRGGGSGGLCALLFLLLALQGGCAIDLFLLGRSSGGLCALLFLLLARQRRFAFGLFLLGRGSGGLRALLFFLLALQRRFAFGSLLPQRRRPRSLVRGAGRPPADA